MDAGGILGTLRILVDADTSKAQRALKSFGGKAQVAGAAIGATIGTLGIAALRMGDDYDAAMDSIRAGTGATGDVLDGLEQSFKNVSGRVTEDIGVTAAVLAQLNTRTGETGAILERTTESIVDLARLAGGDATKAVDGLTEVYRNWNIAAEEQVVANDVLLRAYQASGVGLDVLTTQMTKNGPILRALGYDYEQAAAIIGTLGAAGIDATAVMGPLRKSLANLIKAGQDPKQAIQGIFDAIKNAPDDVRAGQLALEAFGTKGAAMADLIRSGTLDVDAMYETIANGSETVQGLSDDTRDAADGVNEFMNSVKTAVGPITSAFAGIADAMGNAIYLLPALGGLLGKTIAKAATSGPVKAAAAKAGLLISRGIGMAMKLGQGVAMAIANSGAWQKAGMMAGSRFGKAFKIAAIAGLAILIAEGLQELGRIREANIQQVEKIDAGLGEFLAGAPTRAEVEAKLAALKSTPDQLEGIQRDIYNATDIASGTVLGSVVDGIFGSNPATVIDNKVAQLEAYLAKMPPVVEQAGAQTAAAAADAGADIAAGAHQGMAPAIQAFRAEGKRLRASLADTAPKIASAWDAITNALSKGPAIKGFKARMREAARAVRYNAKQLARAIRAGDAVTAGEYAQRLLDAKAARRQLRANQVGVMKDAAAVLGRHQGMARKKQKGITRDVERESRRAARIAERNARRQAKALPEAIERKEPAVETAATNTAEAAKGPLETAASDATTWGSHLGQNFAAGIQSQYGAAQRSAEQLAAAVRSRIAFSRPPRKGPLSGIRSWGPHMVVEWLSPIRRNEHHARKAGERLGRALKDGLDTSGGGSGRRGRSWAGTGPRVRTMKVDRLVVDRAGGGGTVHIHVGTLIANDAGIDQLARRIERRTRIKGRTPTRYNDAG